MVLDMRLAYSRLVVHLKLEGVLIGMLDPRDDQGGGEGLRQHWRVRLAGDTAAGVERRRLTELTVTQHTRITWGINLYTRQALDKPKQNYTQN